MPPLSDVAGLRLALSSPVCRAAGSRAAVLTQDASFELAELGPRLDTELLGQDGAQLAVGAQRVGLAPAVKRQQALSPEPLTQRVFRGQRLELREHLVVPSAASSASTSPRRHEPVLLQPRPLRGGEQEVVQVGERRAAPQGQRLVQEAGGAGGVSGGQRSGPAASCRTATRRARWP